VSGRKGEKKPFLPIHGSIWLFSALISGEVPAYHSMGPVMYWGERKWKLSYL